MLMAGGGLLGSLAHASWDVSWLLPGIPIIVLTLGFYVITPIISSLNDVRKAIIIGGAVPLIMILSWNMIVHGLAGAGGSSSSYSVDPISSRSAPTFSPSPDRGRVFISNFLDLDLVFFFFFFRFRFSFVQILFFLLI
ncbi:hypothetical protein Dimus_014346 [Dionaea muscipula]